MSEKIQELIKPCQLKYLGEMRDFILNIAKQLNFSEEQLFEIQLAADEACINAIDHGSACIKEKNVLIRCKTTKNKLIILVKDYGGKLFNPEYFEKLANKKTWGKGGRGIRIISQIMDEVMYFFHSGNSTSLYMMKYFKKRSDNPKV